MLAKKRKHEKFGGFVRSLRQRLPTLSQPNAELKAERLGLGLVSQGRLSYLERGENDNPDPEMLREMAQLYGVTYESILSEWISDKYEVDPSRLSAGAATPAPTAIKGFVAVPLLATPIAAGAPLLVERDPEHDGALAFREKTVRKFTDPICLRVGRREESMRPLIHPRDIVVIDRDPKRRMPPVNGGVYAVNFGPLTGEEGGALKRIDLVDHTLIVNSDNSDKERYPTQAFMLGREHNLLDILVGEVVWLGRYGCRR